MVLVITLILGTFVSEDLTSISAGLLARNGELSLLSASLACAVGVYVGDLLLWLTGRVVGQQLLQSEWMASRIDGRTVSVLSARIESDLPALIISSRFLPGTRLPVYVAAGISGRRPLAFAAWSLVAVMIWTPLLVLLTASYGSALTSLLLGKLGGISEFVVTAGLLLASLKLVTRVMLSPR